MTDKEPTTEFDANKGVFDSMEGVRDAITVSRVFGDAYEPEGVTIIPVAHVRGGGGGGAGESDDDDGSDGSGFGAGFGISSRPVGAYEVRDGEVRFRPAIDVSGLAKAALVLAGIIAVCTALVKRAKYRAG